MKIVPIDSLAANTDFLPGTVKPDWQSRRLAAVNYIGYQSILQRQAVNNNAPWIGLVGAAHGYRAAGVPGLGELTGAPTVSLRFTKDRGVWPSDYNFFIDGPRKAS